MVAAVTAAATLLCAKRRHGHCAAPDFPRSPQTARFLPKTYFSSNSASPHLACREPERKHSRHSHGTICIAPIILENLLLHAYNVSLKKNATTFSHKGGELDLITG